MGFHPRPNHQGAGDLLRRLYHRRKRLNGVQRPGQRRQWPGLHKLWYPGIRDMSTWSKFGAHGEHGDVFLFSNLGAL